MAGRYEILDILAQDASGVVFHAEERDTGRSVVLRRFFPYGPDGGGLQEAERAAYMAALERLKDFRHPTLRTIIDGGCDPVDGMPFLVTEWVEGQRLSELLKSRPLSPGSTKALITHAIEASKELTEAFGEEAVWVEATPESVVLPVEGEMVTFWICPMKWLASPQKRGGLLPLAQLAEKALHWRGKPVAGTAEGLGTWVKAVRANPNRWSLDEALQALHEPLTMTGQPTQPGGIPTVPMKAAKKPEPKTAQAKRSVLPALLAILLVAGGAAGGFYFFKIRGGKLPNFAGQQEAPAAPAATSALDFGSRDMPKAGESAAVANAPRPGSPALPTSTAPAKPPAAPAPASLTGTVKSVKDVDKFRCLEVEVEGKSRWIAHALGPKKPLFETKELEALKGKRVVASGTLKKEPKDMGEVLHVNDRKQIEVK